MPQLLVSVRSVKEAEAALAGGAHVIDIKDPKAGPLGKAKDTVCRAIIGLVGDRRPVSAAMGEMLDAVLPSADCPLQFVKWGLANCGSCRGWRERGVELSAALSMHNRLCTPVFVAYADHAVANSPCVQEVARWCIGKRMPVLMIDSYSKSGKRLLDWLSLEQLSLIARQCRAGGVRLAVAGSLGTSEVNMLQALPVEWIGVRGAACRGGERNGVIDRRRVARLAKCFPAIQNSKIADLQCEQSRVYRRQVCALQ